MPTETKTKLIGSPFATKNTEPEGVDSLIRQCRTVMDDRGGIVPAKLVRDLEPVTGIKYSRAWLILRRDYLERKRPDLLIAVPAQGALETSAEYARRCGLILRGARELGSGDSWGELMVRTLRTEGWVRTAWSAAGAEKDLGTRCGHGGRFAYDAPDLYRENRKVEGAAIPADFKGRPGEEDLLNFKAKAKAQRARAKAAGGTTEDAARAKAFATTVKLYRRGVHPSTPTPEAEQCMAKVDAMRQQWGFTEAELAKAASDTSRTRKVA